MVAELLVGSTPEVVGDQLRQGEHGATDYCYRRLTMAENVTLRVEGMTCTGCEQRVGKVLRRLDGVREATADHRTGQVRVRFDPTVIDRAALAAQIDTAGYQVTGDQQGPSR